MTIVMQLGECSIQDSHAKARETRCAKRWKYDEQKAAIEEYLCNTWGNPNSPFTAIYDRHCKSQPGDNMADDEYGTIITRDHVWSTPIEADLAPNNIYQRPIPVKGLEGGLEYPRVCKNIDQYCRSELFDGGFYVMGDDAGLSGKESNNSDDEMNDEILPFHASEQELHVVQSHMELLLGHGSLRQVVPGRKVYELIYVSLREAMLQVINNPYARLFSASGLQIMPGAAHVPEDEPLSAPCGLRAEPDFRISIALDALLNGDDYERRRHSQKILEREVCFMQGEIRDSFTCNNNHSRQEAVLYGHTPAAEITDAQYVPFCVGTFTHGLEIEFYLGVPAHPDVKRRGFNIYNYRTVKLSPTDDGIIDDAKYIEALAGFCNQVDLVHERLRCDHTIFRMEDRKIKRRRLNRMLVTPKTFRPPTGMWRGNGAVGFYSGNAGICDGYDSGKASRVQVFLEEANIIARNSFKPARFGSLLSKKRLFIKVFDKIHFGRHEIWMNNLILRTEKLRKKRRDLRRNGRLDGRITKIVWTGKCGSCPVLVTRAEQVAEQPISTPIQLAKFTQEVATVRAKCNLVSLLHGISIVHGDINPNNLIVTRNMGDAKPIRVVVCDFGSAHPIVDDAQLSAPIYPTKGTDGYCAPESNELTSTPASDIYSLGATLRDIMQKQGIKCEVIHHLVMSMLDLDPERRPHACDIAIIAKQL
ncbi:hypothetical protein THASP1DRAFT_23300 [Thamnocephalis sphaerospora]|uniref:Protein kinase domain-containing protein n=1 Tax=Thamnocephalis sphaerospora TaxID=78915 RepID=A0A4V1IWU4_9FUNG|nr:hypothetical protein THASP1DRAFT_23300 [Thamnocephalis sphaerospora]|eukprot:RKP08769.1 hypothetical protein THASP1DRAFT_23300 [Thamnocephalis sphaerospora]